MARSDRPLVAACIAALGLAACVSADSPSTGLHDRDVVETLRGAGMEHMMAAGVAVATTMHAVAAADHQAAEDVISGAIIDDHLPVYVVQLTGGPFIASHGRPGMDPPQGQVLTVTFEQATYRVTDIGFDDVAPDLSKIDAEVVDLLAP